jgi:hypothetical protein
VSASRAPVKSRDGGHHVEADAGHDGANEEDAEGLEAQFVFDEMTAEAEGEHDGGGEDEQLGAVAGLEDGVL